MAVILWTWNTLGNLISDIGLPLRLGNTSGPPPSPSGATRAHFNLETMYDNGLGIIKDDVLGHVWFNIANAKGFAPGIGGWLMAS